MWKLEEKDMEILPSHPGLDAGQIQCVDVMKFCSVYRLRATALHNF